MQTRGRMGGQTAITKVIHLRLKGDTRRNWQEKANVWERVGTPSYTEVEGNDCTPHGKGSSI